MSSLKRVLRQNTQEQSEDFENSELSSVFNSKSLSYNSLSKSSKLVRSRAQSVSDQVTSRGGASLVWTNICVTAPERTKGLCGKKTVIPAVNILKDVSGKANAGSIMAIMGASGSGKTTLLNTFTRREVKGLEVTGQVLLNGEDLGEDINYFSGYIQQEDVFIGTLTVKEHLTFQSKLRMDPELDDDEREQAVEETMVELGLKKCEDTVIGIPGISKGLSGGEKKRLSFASEALKSPLVLFADEPTTGLDSFMAESVVRSMENLARKGRTILCTIHQPSSEVYALFKQVTLMAEGRIVYSGPTSEVGEFFVSAGYRIPASFNPADFFVLTLAVVPGQEKESRERLETIWKTYQESPQKKKLEYELAKDGENDDRQRSYQNRPEKQFLRMVSQEMKILEKKYEARYATQFYWLFWRCLKDISRNKSLVKIRTLNFLYAGIFLGLVYFQQIYNQTGVSNISGALFYVTLQCTFGPTFGVTGIFVNEFPVFKREYKDKTYAVGPYYLAKILSDSPVFIIGAILFSSAIYFLIGLNPYFYAFVIFTCILIIQILVSCSFAHICSSLSENRALTFALVPFIIGLSVFFSGFLLREGTSSPLVSVLIAFQYISSLKWSFQGLLINQWQTVEYIECSYTGVANGTVPAEACLDTGLDVVRSYGYYPSELLGCVLVNIGILVVLEVLSFLLLIRKARNAS